jgi:signal transduction histidine kinase
VALVTVLVISALVRLNSGQSLMNLVVEQQTQLLMETAQNYYITNGTMQGFFDYYLQANRPPPDTNQPNQSNPPAKPPNMRDVRGLHGLVDARYRALIPTFGYDVGQTVPADKIQQAIAVDVNGQTVAWILPDTSFQFSLSPEEELFLQRTTQAIGLAALAGILVAVGMGFLLAGGLLKPIRRLTSASQALAHSDLRQQVPVTSQDELGQLTATFNQMSADLIMADQRRKRLTADITHDLSTPLQVISGYMEMLEDDAVSLTPERIGIIRTEIDHLRRLVGDLSTLTQAESNGLDIQLQPVLPASLLERIYHSYQPIADQQGIKLTLDVPHSSPAILVDEGRMLQVLKNLVDNALRYTPKGGEIKLMAVVGERIQLKVSDNGQGIASEDLPFVFERFFQADKARGVNSGKMGLGLPICQALVTAQRGEISAESAGKDLGTTITLIFDPSPGDEKAPSI